MSLEWFAGLRGQSFILRGEDTGPLKAELVEARSLPASPSQGRQPFSLLFKGPASPLLPQRIYQLAHESEPEPLEIFLVPVSADASGVCYEAVFG